MLQRYIQGLLSPVRLTLARAMRTYIIVVFLLRYSDSETEHAPSFVPKG